MRCSTTKRKSRDTEIDPGLLAIALVCAGLALAAACQNHGHATGSFGSTIYGLGEWLVGSLAPFIAEAMVIIGFFTYVYSFDIVIVVALANVAASVLLLTAIAQHKGAAGACIATLLHQMWGDLSTPIIEVSFAALAYSVVNISDRRIVAEVWYLIKVAFRETYFTLDRAVVTIWQALCMSGRFMQRRTIVEAAAQSDIPIAMPASQSTRNAAYVDVEFVDRSTRPKPSKMSVPAPRYGQAKKISTYTLPPITIFDEPKAIKIKQPADQKLLRDTLASFRIEARIVDAKTGPTVTRYITLLDAGTPLPKLTKLHENIAMALSAKSVTIEAPIPGTPHVGIDVSNAEPVPVLIREILSSLNCSGKILPIALGKDAVGNPVTADLHDMPHLLVAGATGMGKSVCLNNLIASLLFLNTPDEVRMVMIDPKRVEFNMYNGIPHLMWPVVKEPKLAAGALQKVERLMDERYERFSEAGGIRKISEYNERFPHKKLPRVVVFIDELADLMLIAREKVEESIVRIAQLGRASGIHLVIATQKPVVSVISNLIKGNVPSKIAFAVSSGKDSETILNEGETEAKYLLGNGDMLFKSINAKKPVRIQGAYISGEEVERIVKFWRAQAGPQEKSEPVGIIEENESPATDQESGLDPLLEQAARYVVHAQKATVSGLMAHLNIGQPNAVTLISKLERKRIIGKHNKTKPRAVIASAGDIELLLAEKEAA